MVHCISQLTLVGAGCPRWERLSNTVVAPKTSLYYRRLIALVSIGSCACLEARAENTAVGSISLSLDELKRNPGVGLVGLARARPCIDWPCYLASAGTDPGSGSTCCW